MRVTEKQTKQCHNWKDQQTDKQQLSHTIRKIKDIRTFFYIFENP